MVKGKRKPRATVPPEAAKLVGKRVAWRTTAQGNPRRFRGKILAFVPANADVLGHLPKSVALYRLPALRFSKYGRFLIQGDDGKRFNAPRAKADAFTILKDRIEH